MNCSLKLHIQKQRRYNRSISFGGTGAGITSSKFIFLLLIVCCLCSTQTLFAFSIPSSIQTKSQLKIPLNSQVQQLHHTGRRSTKTKNLIELYSSPNDNENNNDKVVLESSSIFSRFTLPKIDDAGLPIADSLLSQIVAPTLQITWLSIAHAPIPTWLYSSTVSNGMLFQSSSSGSLIVPTLIHGAGLTLCWLLGCLAAKNYESDAFNISGGRGYKTVILRLIQSGSFAIGLLILSTQIDLLIEYGRYVQPGESDEIDVRLLNAIVEVINDVVFEAGVLSAWRIYRASLTGSPDGRPKDYEP